MREKRSNYFENSRRAVCIQREYARRNPREFAGYDENCWGLSACDGPSDEKRPDKPNERRRLYGYAARSAQRMARMTARSPRRACWRRCPFAPEAVVRSLRSTLELYPDVLSGGRLASGFNATVADADSRAWVSARHYGLDQEHHFDDDRKPSQRERLAG